MTRKGLCLALALLTVTVGAACGDDDEGTATNLGGDGTTSSSVAGGTTSSTSGDGAAAATCQVEDGVETAGTEVVLGLNEWRIIPDPTSVAAGVVTFLAENAGEEPHEVVIVSSADPAALPTNEDGSMDESQLTEGALIGEIEPFPAGELCQGNFNLDPGPYVLLCNIVETEDGEVESHFELGMFTTFEVT